MEWDIWDVLMFRLHKSQRYTLASLAFALVCIARNAAHGEVASVYVDQTDFVGSHRERRARELFGHDCGASYLAIWHAD